MKLLRGCSFIAVFTIIAALTAPALAHSVTSGAVTVGHIWAYPSSTLQKKSGAYPVQKNGATQVIDIYGPLLNSGGAPEAVTGITTDAGNEAEIIGWSLGNQYTSGFPLELPSGKPVALGPQGQFIRLTGLGRSYGAGDHFPVTFHFAHAPDATIEVMVQAGSSG